MYHIYQTEAFVIGSRPAGEAGREFFLLTRELGLIRASAQGVRLLKSKLRPALQEFSYSEVALVRGKEAWRVTGAVSRDNLFERLKGKPEAVLIFGRIFQLLRRLLAGEEKNESLFAQVAGAYRFLGGMSGGETEFQNVECLLVLRILYALGYLGRNPDVLPFAESREWNGETLALLESVRSRAFFEINRSLRESQL